MSTDRRLRELLQRYSSGDQEATLRLARELLRQGDLDRGPLGSQSMFGSELARGRFWFDALVAAEQLGHEELFREIHSRLDGVIRYTIKPRYSSGSSTQTRDVDLARRVIEQELRGFDNYSRGRHGPLAQDWADREGVSWIVARRFRWYMEWPESDGLELADLSISQDMITGELNVIQVYEDQDSLVCHRCGLLLTGYDDDCLACERERNG